MFGGGRRGAYEDGFVHEENAGVCFEVDSRGFADDVETFDCDICLIGEAKAYKVKHLDSCVTGELLEEEKFGWDRTFFCPARSKAG